LDLFCGAGGATKGYQRAGFYVVGVDIKPQPRYCGDEFVQADAMTYPLDGFNAIHASPPCQHYSAMTPSAARGNHPDLVAATRDRLVASGAPWVIENVMPAPLRSGVVLCGCMFDLRTYRARRFESSELMMQPEHRPHIRRTVRSGRPAAFAAGANISVTTQAGAWLGSACMGIDWMKGNEVGLAIPPAYTEWIGRELLRVLAGSPHTEEQTP
jgi:DNA (cytosine-5)-methyltransferase 1